MPELCEDCHEIKKLEFQLCKTNLDVKEASIIQTNKDIEHESMIQNLGNRMNTMSQDFIDFKKEMKDDIQSIKNEIPDMFDNAINKLMARILKTVSIGVLIVICVVILAFSRPIILRGIDELRHCVETVEVTK